MQGYGRYNTEQTEKTSNNLKQHKKFFVTVIILCFVLVIMLSYSFLNNILNTRKAQVSSYDYKDIDINNDPVQNLYRYYSKQRTEFEYTSLKSHNQYKLLPVAYYKISGLVVTKNTYFPIKTTFDDIALYDIGLVWGKLANHDFFKKNCKAESSQYDDGARMIMYNCIDIEQLGYNFDDLESHISHTHLIPANDNIKTALYSIKKYDIVELEGELVNIILGKETIETSIERDDDDGSSSGDGACEIMYLKKIKIGTKIYE